MYNELKEIQKLIFKGDDLMDQDTLFELQDRITELTLTVAIKENKTNDLVKSFPWLYKVEERKVWNMFPSKEIIQVIKNRYSKGQRVELVNMNDPYTTLKPGDKGYVDFVDDYGTVFVNWDNGSKLGVVYGEDAIKKI